MLSKKLTAGFAVAATAAYAVYRWQTDSSETETDIHSTPS